MKAWVRRGNLQRHQVGSVPMAAVQMVLRLSPPQPTEGRDVEWSPTSSPTPVSTPHAVGRLAGDPVGDVGVQPGHAPRDVGDHSAARAAPIPGRRWTCRTPRRPSPATTSPQGARAVLHATVTAEAEGKLLEALALADEQKVPVIVQAVAE